MARDLDGKGGNPARAQLHDVRPRELTGRDVIARFQSQFRGAALASLQILEGKGLDRVYCDYQDDFVTREKVGDSWVYHFVQVKTKGKRKHRWSRLDLFGLPKRLPAMVKEAHGPGGLSHKPPTAEQATKIRDSFVGKLIEHTVNFGEACGSATFLTNVHLDDDVEKIADAIDCGDKSERTLRYFTDHFAEIFVLPSAPAMGHVHASIARLTISPGHEYLDPHHPDFDAKATKAVWEYSEINLSHTEGVELVEKLLALVQQKSSNQLVADLSAGQLDTAAGIGIDDLLGILPISRGAYYTFLTQGE